MADDRDGFKALLKKQLNIVGKLLADEHNRRIMDLQCEIKRLERRSPCNAIPAEPRNMVDDACGSGMEDGYELSFDDDAADDSLGSGDVLMLPIPKKVGRELNTLSSQNGCSHDETTHHDTLKPVLENRSSPDTSSRHTNGQRRPSDVPSVESSDNDHESSDCDISPIPAAPKKPPSPRRLSLPAGKASPKQRQRRPSLPGAFAIIDQEQEKAALFSSGWKDTKSNSKPSTLRRPSLRKIDEASSSIDYLAPSPNKYKGGDSSPSGSPTSTLQAEESKYTMGRRPSETSLTSERLVSTELRARRQPYDIYTIDALHTEKMLEFEFEEPARRPSPDRSVQGDFEFNDVHSIWTASDGGSQAERELPMTRRASDMDTLRKVQENEIMSQSRWARQDYEIRNAGFQAGSYLGLSNLYLPYCLLIAPSTFLHLFSVAPRSTTTFCKWYGRFIFSIFVLLCAHYVYVIAFDTQFIYLRLAWACHGFGAVLGLGFLRRQNINGLLGSGKMALEKYARTRGFLEEWLVNSFVACVKILMLWLCSVVMSVLLAVSMASHCQNLGRTAWAHPGDCSDHWFAAMIFPCAGAGLFAALVYCHVHICTCLELIVDRFCISFFENPDISVAISEWNTLQAILRRAANTIESCFLVVQTSMLCAVLLTGAELVGTRELRGTNTALWLMSFFPCLLLTLYALSRASNVTEKCSRVPALLNSFRFDGSPINVERQYIVQYIDHSAAGFYIGGVRLTAFMVMKVTYVIGMLAFALATRFSPG